jgi:chromosome segregation ATPase
LTLPCIVLFFQTQLSTLGDDDGETQNKNKSKSRTKKPALERKTKRKALGSVHSASRIALSDVKLNESQRRSHSAENPSASSSAFKSAKDVSARQTKAMALEAGIRRLQKDVERHRATEASLRAALDAETEVWKFDCSVSDEEELHEKLAASLDVQAQMQEELARELTLRITAEEASEQAKKDLDSLQRDFDSLKDDVAQRATASKERDNLFEELRRETEARRTAEVAYEEAQSRVQTLEKTLAKQRSELRSRASENSQEITSSLETAKAEATQARARVEETLAALTRAKQAERGARKSELATANAARAELKEMKRRLAKESEKRQKAEAEAQTIQMKLEEHIDGDRRDDSSKIAEAIQSKEMAEAQASMLRSCLEDTEEMLEESRATARTLEAKLKETQVMQKSDPSVDEKMQTLLSRAEEAEQSVSAARLIAKHAEEGLATARHDAEDMAQYLKNLVAEHEAAISRLHAESKEKDESIEALRRAHDETLSKSKVLDEMLIRAEQTKRQLNEQLSKANAEVKTLTETRVQHDDSAVHERLASMQQKLNSVEDAKSGAEASLQLIQEEVKQLQLKLAEKEAKDAGATVPVPIKVTPTDDMVVQTDPPPKLIDICTQMDASIDVRVKLSADIEEKSKALEDVQLRFIAAEVKHNADLAAMQQLCDELKSKADASAHSANELESKLVWATQRSSDLESELVTLREEAKLSLDVKVKEVVAATQAARDALLGKSAAETEIQQLKHMLSKYEEVASSNDEMEIDVVELREALSNAAVTIRKQEASLSELTVRLEAAEAASADGEAQNALLRDELAAKLEKAEESHKTARAENAKHEWTISELKSRLDMSELNGHGMQDEIQKLKSSLMESTAENSRMGSAASKQAAESQAKVSELQHSLNDAFREIEGLRLLVKRFTADLKDSEDRVTQLRGDSEASVRTASELKHRCEAAEKQASEIDSAFSAFKTEAKARLELQGNQLMEQGNQLMEAQRALTDAATKAQADEEEVQRLKLVAQQMEATPSIDEALKVEVLELREALHLAQEAHEVQETSLSELTVRLEAAEAASADGEAQNALLRDELAAKLEKAEESLKTARAENAKHEWKVSVLTSDLDMQKSWTAAKEREVSELNEALVMVRAEVQSATSEATAKLSSTTNELSEARQTIDKFRRKLDEACQLSDRLASELDISKQKLLTATVDAAKFKKDFEAKCVEAETQANEAAAVLSAFKRDANATLKQKTDELVALSGVATDTKAAKDCAETELRRLRQAIAQHEANVSTDEALRVEVIELREALSDALEAHKNQRTSLSELTVRLEAAEAASADGEAQNALLRDELAAKLEKAEESHKTARAENAKHEWTISELKSRVQVGEVKLKDATSKVTSTSAKLAESEDSLAVSIRELKESRRRVTQIAADLERVQHKHEKSIEASYQTEMKLAAAEQRAAWAEAALVAFKQERLHDLEVKSQQVKSVETSHADNTLEEFKKIANVSLERRTTEMLLATRVASEATAAKEAAEAEILRMKQTLEAVQAKTAADVHLQSDVRDLQAILVQSTKMLHQRLEAVDEAVATKEAGNKLVSQLASIESLAAQEAARTEVNRLTCLVADAEKENGASKEKIHKLEAEVHILQSSLAEARKAHDSQLGLQDELRSQLIALQLSHDAREKDHEEAAAKLRHQFDEKLEASMRELKETTDRAAKAMASKELADAEVIRLVALCSELEKRDEAAIEDAVKAKTAELTKRITGLQKDHDEALSLCDSLRLQLDTVAAAAEKANELNDRCIQEAEVDASAASIVMHEMSDQLAQLNSEVTAAKANITSLSAVRESLEDELLSMEVEIKVALEERTQAMQEVSELKKSISGLGKVRDDLVVAHSEMRKLKEAEEREVELQLRAENAEQRERELHTKIISTQSALRELRLENGSMETRLACGAAELSSAKEEAVQLREEVKKIQLAALDASASDTNVKSKINAVKEALKDSEAALEIERLAREAAEARVSALEQRLSLLNSTAGEFTQQLDEGSNEEIAQLLDVAQEEVERSRAECQIAKKELRGAKSRVRQLEEEVLRLQKHEHALHALLGSA